LGLGVGLLNTEIKAPASFGYNSNFGTGANAFVGDPFFFNGGELGGPQQTANGLVRFHIPIAGGKMTLQADFDWREASIGTGGNDISYSEDRSLVNLRVFWSSPSERWDIQAYVENAFDEEYIDNMSALAGSDSAYGNMGMPQWYGVKFGMSF
jgi:iron complex outermembrane receptor protein